MHQQYSPNLLTVYKRELASFRWQHSDYGVALKIYIFITPHFNSIKRKNQMKNDKLCIKKWCKMLKRKVINAKRRGKIRKNIKIIRAQRAKAQFRRQIKLVKQDFVF